MLDEEEKTIIKPLGKKPEEALEPGTQLGQYKLIRLLGRGGMGEVYEAEHTTLGINFALKLLPPDLLATTAALERFRREARVMAQLRHPHLLHVDDFGETEGRYWLRMELANGIRLKPETGNLKPEAEGHSVVSLAEWAEATGGRLPQQLLLGILQQIVSGLAYAHERGVVHRDLKPSNILLISGHPPSSINHPPSSLGFTAKIADFGLVRLVGAEWLQSRVENSVRLSASLGEQATLTGPKRDGSSTRSLLGTFEYMSPEQKRGEEADARSDLYALGLLTFRLLTGQREPGFELPSQIHDDIVPAWDALVRAALQPRKERRVADCGVVTQHLEAIAAELSQGSEKPAVAVSKPRKVEPPPTAKPASVSEVREPSPAAQAAKSHQPGKTMTVNLGGGVTMEFAWIPAGEFLMGSPVNEAERFDNEGPQHRVTLTKGFWMGKSAVTQAQWEVVMGKNPAHFKKDKILEFGGKTIPNLPVENVSWNDCQEFIGKINVKCEIGNWKASLPTEAQWEYACRAGTTTRFHAGDTEDDLARVGWYVDNSGNKTHAVGEKEANRWGLYDMHGNVWEWCQDWFGQYNNGAVTDPTGPNSGSYRVLRGGSWYYNSEVCRSASRGWGGPGIRDDFIGLRVVLLPR